MDTVHRSHHKTPHVLGMGVAVGNFDLLSPPAVTSVSVYDWREGRVLSHMYIQIQILHFHCVDAISQTAVHIEYNGDIVADRLTPSEGATIEGKILLGRPTTERQTVSHGGKLIVKGQTEILLQVFVACPQLQADELRGSWMSVRRRTR